MSHPAPISLRFATLVTVLMVAHLAHSQIPEKRENPDFNSSDPYGFGADLNELDAGSFEHCRWGVHMDVENAILPYVDDLKFTKLTKGEDDLFISTSLRYLTEWNLLESSDVTWKPIGSYFTGAGSLSFPAVPGKSYHLLRKLSFESNPFTTPDGQRKMPGSDAKKVIILIHGWNPESDSNMFDESSQLSKLMENIQEALNSAPNAGWELFLYHWERDADTGPNPLGGDVLHSATNGCEAAEGAHLHGQHLGTLLVGAEALEKVHLICHSAGTWVARGAAKKLLSGDRPPKVQITFLDPFIPNSLTNSQKDGIPGFSTKLAKERIDEIGSFGTLPLFRIENYFTIDPTGPSTHQVFSWRADDESGLEVGGGVLRTLGFDPYGGPFGHDGPIQYYADTVYMSSDLVIDQAVPSRLSRAGLAGDSALNYYGWRRSLFYNEPVIWPRRPVKQEVSGGGNTLSGAAHLRGSPATNTGITYQWEVSTTGPTGIFNPHQINGQDMAFRSSSVLILSIAEVNVGRRWFRLVAKTTAGIDAGDAIPVGSALPPTTPSTNPAPATPSNLVATAVSASQINLTWSSNTTGFRIQRRTTNTAFADIGSANGTAFHNTAGLSPGTKYFYQVRAVNGIVYSNEADATTFLAASATVPITVRAVDDSSANPVALNVSIASWTDGSSHYANLTTSGASGFTRSLPSGTIAWFSAPQTLPDGRRFQYWLFSNGTTAEQSDQTPANFLLTAATNVIAIYAPAGSATRTPSALVIEGPSAVDEDSSASYKAKATYSGGTSGYVSASWTENSSFASISNSGRLDTESVSSPKTVTIEASFTADGVTRTATKTVTIRDAVATRTYTLTRTVEGGGRIGFSPTGTSYAAGTVVSLHANEDSGWVFSHWSGDVSSSSTDDDITVRMDRNRSVTAHFVVDTTEGNIRVDISPPQAVEEGAGWKYDNYLNFRPSGDTFNGLSPRTGRYVRFKDIPGWIAPDSVAADIVGGQTTVVSGATATYREILGSVQVSLSPSQAGQAGARWRIDGGTWNESSVTVQDVSTGSHTIDFLAIAGWSTAPPQAITVERGVTTTREGGYGPPAGFPVVTAVYPRTGPIEGGTVVTIDGTNFQPGASVTFGGVAATSVTVVNPARITAVTPARASYGSVSLILSSGGQTISQANGFSYLNLLGSNIELVGQIGGNVQTVAVNGNTVYYGEGPGLVVCDFTNSASPVERGRIALPTVAQNVFVANGIAYVASGGAGLYAIDVSNPAAPSIVGFFDTEGSAMGVTVSGSVAYVADYASGLQILDVTNPAAIVRLGVLDTAGIPQKVAAGTIGTKKYAFLAERNQAAGLRIIDVTVPSFPAEIANMPADGNAGVEDVKLVGTTLYLSDWQGVVKILNVSNPASPIQIGSGGGNGGGAFLDVTNTKLYTCAGILRAFDLTAAPDPAFLGQFNGGSSCTDLAVANGLAFAAMGRDGLKVISVSNPTSMSLRSSRQTLGGVEDVWVSGSIAYVGNDAGLHTVDISNPAMPVRLATLAGSRVTEVVVSGGIATLVNYGDNVVRIANVANPSSLSQVGTYAPVEAWNLALKGNTPVLAAATDDTAHRPKLDVLNLSSPSNPQSNGSILLDGTNGIVAALAIVGDWAFAGRMGWGGSSSNSLDVVNLANPGSPQKIGSLSLGSSNFRDLAASSDGNYVYLPSESGIQVIDVTSKAAPVVRLLVDSPQTPGISLDSLLVAGNRLFATDSGFIIVFDISDPTSPQTVGYYDIPSAGSGIAVANDLIFVAGNSGGVTILRLMDVDKPTLAITSPTTNTSFPTTSALISLGGSATDLQGVVRVTWENNRGGGGTAAGTNTWSIADIQLAGGVNVLTVTAEDSQGNLARDSITVTATLPETTGPAILVTGPKPPPAFTITADTLPLTGTSSDVSGVQSVAWANDRGGSGTATGTTVWSADIPLLDGPNRITVTARDTVGNESQSSVLVTYLPPDSIAPTVAITFPTAAQESTTTEPQVSLSGEADDDRAVSRVTWANNRGGSGVATGSRVWYVNGIVLQPGVNVLTISSEDTSGNVAADTLTVTFTPAGKDPARPVLAIQSPTAKSLIMEQDHIVFSGQASGGSAIAEVVVQSQGGPWLGATGTGNWTTDVPLALGRNVIRFKSIDSTGRESLVTERVVTYRKLAYLSVTKLGEGSASVVGNPPLAAMEVGKLYTADATPARGWIFAGWEGSVVSNSRRVSFVMDEGAALNARFVENPYGAFAGRYRGLLRAESLTHATSGHSMVTLTPIGAFTAGFVIGGKRLTLKGALDGTGTFLGRLRASRTQIYDVMLTLDTSRPANEGIPITGLLSDGTTTMSLSGWPTLIYTRAVPAPEKGTYTVAINPGSTVGTPIGFGTGRMTVGDTGTIAISSRLANGTPVTFSSAITAGTRAPIYAAMDGGRSSFSSQLTFADKPDSDLDGSCFWSSARVRSRLYSFDPFTYEPRLFAQRYTIPFIGERALRALDPGNGAGTLSLDDGLAPLTQSITLGTDNKITPAGAVLNGFMMTLSPKRGDFSGSLLLPANGRRTSFSGVLLQKSREGLGMLLGPDTEMAAILSPAP